MQVIVNDIQDGSLDIYDYCLPALPAGNWSLETNQKVVWKEHNIEQAYSKSQAFTVAGPRFTIDPSEVHAVYPPANSQGYYDNIFPHCVLNKRTLPWERTIDDNPPDTTNPIPWMALMVLSEDEIVVAEGKKAQPQSLTVNDVVNPGSTILGPQGLKDVTAEDLKSPCYAVDVSPDVFKDIIPAKEELPYLAHCRKVDMTSKEPMAAVEQEDGQGWFSVVVANRMPSDGKKSFVCLVSLEGFENYLYGGSDAGKVTDYDAVRIVTLAFWNFETLSHGSESFSGLMQGVSSGQLKMPQVISQSGSNEQAEKLVQEALSDGYVPMTYQMRVGEKTVAWYRGPFSSVLIKENDDIFPIFSAESALIYDPDTGMFDVSYAVAWQIGRLLALSDRNFATGILKWRQQQNIQAHQYLAMSRSIQQMPALLGESKEDFLDLLDPRTRLKKMSDILGQKLAGIFAPENPGQVGPFFTSDPSGILHLKNAAPGVLDKEELLEALSSGKSLLGSLREKIFDPS